ncbi:MAG TPA: FtsX-like permease family protein [Solirubrobacteraceae bacterium]|nr:FtsX-like permease family protein [Solirubrobacteraceae bacterium]
MRFSSIIHLYRVRLRARALQEIFAIVGIAAGVGLLFVSQIASASLSSSVGKLNSGIVGKASLQITARDPHGFDEQVLGQVRHLQGVRLAAGLIEATANVVGPKGTQSVQLVGADSSLTELGGALVKRASLTPFAGLGAVVLPAPVAKTIGVTAFGKMMTFQVGGENSEAALYAQLHQKQIGALINSPIAIGPLEFSQELAGLKGRLNRILVEPAPGQEAQVLAGLKRLAGNQLDVESSNHDEKLFAKAAAASNQSTALFAVISALVGFLFAFNAMLLTVPQRRRLIVDLRRDGYTPGAVVAVLLLDAVVLGVIATALGLLLGDELSIHLFHSNPGYLSSAFALGSERVVSWQSIAIAAGGGMIAACVAVLSPLRDILSRDPLAATTLKQGSGGAQNRWLLLGGLAALALTLGILLFAPEEAIVGMVSLIAALLLLLPIPLNATLALVKRAAPAVTSVVPHIAVMELRSGRSRAVAIAATGAIAVFGAVSIQGAHGDLLKGLENAARDTNASTDVWVSAAGSSNLLMTTPFPPTEQSKLEKLPGVRSVGLYRGGLLDEGDRRIWVIAPPSDSSPLIPPTQLIEGNVAQADARLRAGGWAVVSQAIAEERHLHIGRPFTLNAPHPTTVRLAAVSTNIGWAPGAIIISAEDYARAWESNDVSAFSVRVDPGSTPRLLRTEIRTALGPNTGLAVQTAEQHEGKLVEITRQGLTRLSQIATLILIAAILAMAAAMGALIWQRRPRLAKLKLEGFAHTELWQTIVLESFLLVGVGCTTGAIFGLLGQQLLDHALSTVINYPVVSSLGILDAIVSLALVTAAAVVMVAAPGYFAAEVPAALALQD